MQVALPAIEPDAAAARRRPEHLRRADLVVGHGVTSPSHRLSPDPAKGVGKVAMRAGTVTRNPQLAIPEARR